MRRKTTEWCYLVKTHYMTDIDQLMVLSGSSCPTNPCLRISTIKKNKLKSHADLKLNKSAVDYKHSVVRTSCFDSLSNAIFTGNEKGDIALWMPS